MTINWKIWAPAGMIAAAVVFLAYSQFGVKAPTSIGGKALPAAEETLPPAATAPATGKVDDAVNALLQEISQDQSAFALEKEDSAFLGADSREISGFGQTYNENEF